MDGLAQDTDLVRKLVAYSNLAPATVAKRAGVAPSTVNRPFNGTATTRLGRATLEKLQAAFPEFPGWAAQELLGDRKLPFQPFQQETDADIVELEEIDLRYGLGGTYLDSPVTATKRRFSRQWLRMFTRSAPEHLFWTQGDGDSMEPTIRSGEVILIDRSQLTPRMGDGIWALAWGDIGMIKRLRPLPDGSLEIHSDNPLVRPAVAVDGEIHVIGRVVAVVKVL